MSNTNIENLSIEQLTAILEQKKTEQERLANASTVEAYKNLLAHKVNNNGSTRDIVAIAYTVANGGKLSSKINTEFSAKKVMSLLQACGETVSNTDGQYRQGVPQLFAAANSLGVELEISVKLNEKKNK